MILPIKIGSQAIAESFEQTTSQSSRLADVTIPILIGFTATAVVNQRVASLTIAAKVGFEATAQSPVPAQLSISIPISFTATAKSPNAARLDINIPLSFSATASSPNTARVTIPTLVRFAVSGAADRTARVNIVVPVGFSATAYQNSSASLVISVPVSFAATAANITPITIGEISAYIMNTTTAGHSVYSDYNFNSFFRLNGSYYGCNSTGIYRLDGATDNGTVINWRVKTPISDFGTYSLKFVHDARLIMRTDGDIELGYVVDEQTKRTDAISYSDERQGLHARRIKLPKGVKGTDWQFEVSGSGVTADIKELSITPLVSQRTQH